jgi:outer membrane protein insertion porin family
VTNNESVAIDDTGSLRLSVGTGITWTSPFGLIGIDLGFPVVKEDFDIDEVFRLNFGTRF